MNLQEEFARLGLSDLMLKTMRNKEAILKEIFRILMEQQKCEQGLDNFIKAVDDGKTSNAQLGKMLRTMARVQKEQANALRQLCMVALVYTSGGSLSSDAAKVACNLGRGQEAIQEILKEKFGGKNPFAAKV
jgi:hypothetical protein